MNLLRRCFLTPATCYCIISSMLMAGISDAFSFAPAKMAGIHMTAKEDSINGKADSNVMNRSSFVRSAVGGFAAMGISSINAAPAIAATAPAKTLPATEKRAPDFNMENSKGEGTTTLADLTKDGKWTVLYFYPGAFTSGCTLEARNFQRDITKYRSLNAQIVGVSVDPVEKNASFCSSEGLDFYMLSDNKGQVSKLYGSALSIPGFGTFSNRQTYIIDPKGNLKWVFTDVESRVPRHSEEVLEKLAELKSA